jgi:hypothetical protein
MKEKIRYTDEPMEMGRVLPDFLPPPDQLVFKEDAVKVTITLTSRSVFFFKTEAAKRGISYQRMIRRLLDAYVGAFQPTGEVPASQRAKGDRVAQPRAPYRKTVKRRASR